jgi:hypothetical protein
MNRLYPFAFALVFSAPLVRAAEQPPTTASDATPSMAQQMNRRASKKIMLINGEGATITLWKPDLSSQTLTLKDGAITLPNTGMNNYHALVVQQDWGTGKESVIRYEYLAGKPSKQSPSKLTEAVKSQFEIVPDPIPREHYRYYSDHKWGFILRLHGKPKAGIEVNLKTENGSQLHAISDYAGRVAFRLPEDFPETVPAGERDKRSAEFAVSATTTLAGMSYETMLTARYYVNPSHWQSSKLGLFVTGLGFFVGSLIGRSKSQAGKKA